MRLRRVMRYSDRGVGSGRSPRVDAAARPAEHIRPDMMRTEISDTDRTNG